MTAEAILTELYENFQDGKYWDKALKKIKEYVNQRVIEELKQLKDQDTYSTDFALDLRIKELKQ